MKHSEFAASPSRAMALALAILLLVSSAAMAQTYRVLHPFTWGAYPAYGLTMDASGNLYGVAMAGGIAKSKDICVISGCGTVFKLAPNSKGSWTVTTLHAFSGHADGGVPDGPLIVDAAGNLYGTAEMGGAHLNGVVFKLSPESDGSWQYSVLYSFKASEAGGAGLVFDAAGNLYSTAQVGGTRKEGAVLKFTPSTGGLWTEEVIYSFCSISGCLDGSGPSGPLIFDSAGNLYGSAAGGTHGFGMVFELEANKGGTWTEIPLYNFTGGTDGLGPGSVIIDAAGNLYGTTTRGGTNNDGVLFKLAPEHDGSWTESVLYTFCSLASCADGSTPVGVTLDTAGNLYGTAEVGGAENDGVVFRLTPASGDWSETVLHSFLGYGALPFAGVILDSAGNLYGTTQVGTGNFGLAWEITP